jgi:predicted SAM-dependent methyltransferase
MRNLSPFVKHTIIFGICRLVRPVHAARLRRLAARAAQGARLNLGSGGHNAPGWINVDISFRSRPDIILDLTRALPLPDASVQFIFTEDFIEHIEKEQCQAFIKECRRMLKPGGVLRVRTPNLRLIAEQYLTRDPHSLAWYREQFGSQTHADMLNAAYHKMEHRFMYDRETLGALLEQAGFSVHEAGFGQSLVPELAAMDQRKSGLTLDAVRPS